MANMSVWSMMIYADKGLTACDKACCVGFVQLKNFSKRFPKYSIQYLAILRGK